MNKSIQSSAVREYISKANPHLYKKLVEKQKYFSNIGDVLKYNETQLMSMLDLTLEEVRNSIQLLRSKYILPHFQSRITNALQLSKRNERRLPTGLKTMDQCLFGGVPSRIITEIAGTTQSGKTLFCIKLALQLLFHLFPEEDAQILYIDTERKLDSTVILEMIKTYTTDNNEIERVMKLIKCMPVSDDLAQCVKQFTDSSFQEMIIENNVKMIIIDSVFNIARNANEYRDRSLAALAAWLKQITDELSLYTVVTNHMKISKNRFGTVNMRNVELGYMWAHAVNIRILLDNEFIIIDKSPLSAEHSIAYKIANGTIESAEDELFNEQQDLYSPPTKK
jgi:DNA repair protein RadA